MSWMVGRNHYTVPAGRLDLGRKPNINIHTEKIYNNYGTGFAGMPYGSIYGGMYGGFDYGYGYGNYDTGLTKGEKWMLALGGIASLGGAVLSAFTGGSQKVESAGTDTAQAESQSKPLTAEDVAQITRETIESTMSELQKKENAEIAERKEAAKLQQEGITKNDDGTYTATVKDIFGQTQTITASTLAEVRSNKEKQESEIKEQQEFCQANNIEIKQDGTFATTIKGPDGKEEIITGTTPEGVKQEADDKSQILNSGNEDLLA